MSAITEAVPIEETETASDAPQETNVSANGILGPDFVGALFT